MRTNSAIGTPGVLSALSALAAITWAVAAHTLPLRAAPPVAATTAQVTTALNPIVLPADAVLPVAFPFRLWNGLPVVESLAAGLDVEQFVIDTGMSADAMSPAGIIRLQMTALPGKAHLRLVNLTTDVSQASLKSLRLGLITLKDIPMAALDVPAFLSRAPHPDAPAGWLGTPFLSAFQVTIDSAQRLVLLESPGAKPPTGHGVTTVPVQIKDGRPYISVSLPGAKPFSALIGTGVVLTMIPRAAAQKAGLKAVETLPVTGTDGKPGKIALALLPRLLVGKAEVKSMRIAYLAADSPDALDPELAVLGMDFLSRFRATLNIDKKRLYLTPAAQSDSAAPAAPAPKPSSRSAGRR